MYFEFSAAREMFSYFLLHSMPASILILCLKSQINSEGEAGVVCFGNINSLPAGQENISIKNILKGKDSKYYPGERDHNITDVS